MLDKILNNKPIYNTLLFLGFLFWCYLVYRNAIFSMFNNDEILAWEIAHDLSFNEIVQLMHYEGHSFLWYMVLKPFIFLTDKIPALFPAVLKYINLAFIGAAMLLLWLKAPINIFLKILISCTSPFVVTFPSNARPYGLLILLLFIIVIQYKDRLKHPLIYSVLLLLLANTCFNGLAGAIFLSASFIYELYKENKSNLVSSKFIVPVFIICSSFLMLAIEWIPIHTPVHIKYFGTVNCFRDFFLPAYSSKLYMLASLCIFLPLMQIAAIIQFANMKNRWFLLFAAYILNVFLIFYLVVAPGRPHHLYFIYIYFLVIYWLMLDNSEEFIQNKINFYSTTGIITLLTIIYLIPFRNPEFWFIDEALYKESSNIIKTIIPEGSRVYLIPDYGSMAAHDLKNDYDVRTHYGKKITSLDSYESIYQDYYFRPQDIYVPEGQKAYYIAPVQYVQSMEIQNYFDIPNCDIINDVYYLCTLEGKNTEE